MRLLVFTLAGLGLGSAVAALVRIYVCFGLRRTKVRGALESIFWILYVPAIFIGPMLLSRYLEGVLFSEPFSGDERIVFVLLWFMPAALTAWLSLAHRRNKPS